MSQVSLITVRARKKHNVIDRCRHQWQNSHVVEEFQNGRCSGRFVFATGFTGNIAMSTTQTKGEVWGWRKPVVRLNHKKLGRRPDQGNHRLR